MFRTITRFVFCLALAGGLSLGASVAPSAAHAADVVPDTIQLHVGTAIQRMPDASARVVEESEWHARGSYGLLVDTPLGLAAGVDLEVEEHSRNLFRGIGGSTFERTAVLFRLRYGYRLPIPLEQLELIPYATAAAGPSFATLRLTSDGRRFRESASGFDLHAALGAEARLFLEMVFLGVFVDGGLMVRAPLDFNDMSGPEGSENIEAGTLRTGGGVVRLGIVAGVRF